MSELSADPAALWLCQLPGMTPEIALRLVALAGSAAEVVRMPSATLRLIGLSPSLVAKIVAGSREVPQVAAGFKGWQRLGITPLPLVSAAYPQRLLALEAPPLVVFVQGRWPISDALCCVIAPDALEPSIATSWAQLVRAIDGRIGIAALPSTAELAQVPRLIGLPYGLMLARQRLPQTIIQAVAAGTTTLLSIAPPAAQPQPPAALLIEQALVALADALVVLMPPPADLDQLMKAARSANLPAFAYGAAPRSTIPRGLRRLRPGSGGAQMLLRTLGVQVAGVETVQQGRLF